MVSLDRQASRFLGSGLELGAAAILPAAVGYALDRYLGNTTLVCTALLAMAGFAAGMFRFIRAALAVNRSYRPGRKQSPDEPEH